ncbi:hypothetical protein [Chitinophaga arvensicola]|nr:hypothetical protein [Chitinophaga arvensicola]
MKLYSRSVMVLLLVLAIYIPAHAFSDTTRVLFLSKEDVLPDGLRKIGNVKVTDGGFKMNCGYEQTMQQATDKAIQAGGNIVKIKELKHPDMFSTCYRLTGEIYYYPDILGLIAEKFRIVDSIINTVLPDTASYALLYIYRPDTDLGAGISYNVLLDDSVVCRVKNSTSFLIKVYKTGTAKISAKTETRKEVTLDIRPGKAYFIKCTIAPGGFVGRPELNVIEASPGLYEFNAVKEKPKLKVMDSVY